MIEADALDGLATLEAGSIQCCVTSPPYWGLRDHGTAEWDGGDAGCDHRDETRHQAQGATSARAGRANVEAQRSDTFRHSCPCGAVRVDRQIGLEPTPAEYVAKMVAVFAAVRRVLRDDGTLWLNLGDSYAGGGRGGNPADSDFRKQATNAGSLIAPTVIPDGLKAKDLVGIPWRVALALQADGWYLRSDIIWAKPNPMPESVTDRPTKSHEYVFLLSKSARYLYNAAAIAEPAAYAGKVVTLAPKSLSRGSAEGLGIEPSGNGAATEVTVTETRNARSVWTIPTCAYPEAHFATFPLELASRCIKAGSNARDAVLDPFAGSGTTLAAAKTLDRLGLGIELNPAYATLARRRIASAPMPNMDLFA